MALALLAVTAVLAWRLALSFHLAWPPVLVSIIGTLPALYLAWLAVPGAISPPESAAADKPAYGRPAGRWNSVELGVHRVIGGGPMPKYVRRPHDGLLRAVLDPAVPASRLVVVRGGSSTGKTRAAYEAIADRLADWQLDYPLDPGALAARLDAGIPARTVLWLGELRQYADADGGPAVLARLADLLTGEGHLVITTLWPEQWTTYTAAARAGPAAADAAGTAGRLLARLPELTGSDPAGIDPARGGVIDVPARFTDAEMAIAARADDLLLAEAAAAAARAGQEGQVTQYLAGAPDLLDRYAGRGGDPYGQAVITAAMDATRLGHASPLSAALLQEAAVGYLTDRQRTIGIESWRDTALAWAADELKGAVRALQPVPPPKGTGVAGYTVADYLIQHANRERRYARVPASIWDAVLSHIHDPADAARLADSAERRLLYRYAIPLYRHAADASDWHAAEQLAWLLARRGDLDGLRARADAGDRTAAHLLILLLEERGDPEGLRALATAGDVFAAMWLAGLLEKRGDLDGLRALADAGSGYAALRLAWLLEERGDLDGLRALATADENVTEELATLLEERGDLDGAEQILRGRVDIGDRYAALRLAWLLKERGDLDGAEQILHALADAHDRTAAHALVDLLEERGDLDGLYARVEAGDAYAAVRRSCLLEKRGGWLLGDAWADGDGYATSRLADLLEERDDLDGLRARAADGDGYAASRLAGLLTRQSRGEEVERLRRFGLNPDGSIGSM